MAPCPFDCVSICPGPIRAILPSTWTKIQDWTHLFLLFCFGTGVTIVVYDLFILFNGFSCMTKYLCVNQFMAFIFIGPVLMYSIRLIGDYDDRLQSTQKQMMDSKKALTDAYSHLIEDMDDFLSRAAESSAGLAERSFESKRRDFLRFLEHCSLKFEKIYDGSKAERDQFLNQFRSFVQQWLQIFKECSVDPVSAPKLIVDDKELQSCTDLKEMCELIVDRLRKAEVKFYSSRKEDDMAKVTNYKAQAKTLAIEDVPGLAHKKTRVMASDSESFGSVTSARNVQTSRDPMLEISPTDDDLEAQRCPCTWLMCGKFKFQCCYLLGDPDSDNPFPRVTSCFCCRCAILSRDHVTLVAGFLVALLLFFLEIVNPPGSTVSPLYEMLMTCFILSLLGVIIHFQRVDILLRLEREVKKLEEERKTVEDQKKQMAEFWGGVQELTELWLHRTVPRLDLVKEIHSQLEDIPPEQVMDQLHKANDCLKRLEDDAGSLESWKSGGELDEKTKKKFGDHILKAGRNANKLPQLLADLDTGLKKGSFNTDKLMHEPLAAITGPTDAPSSYAAASPGSKEGYEGWLMKRGPRKSDSWKLRYCRLAGRRFTYGTGEDYASIKGEFLIKHGAKDVNAFKSPAASKEARELGNERPHGIEISAEGRSYLFDAREESSLQKWLTALKRVG